MPSPKWSHDGTRIVFGAWPSRVFESCRIKAIEVKDGLPSLVDLGPGNSPTLSPDDKRIVFALEPGREPGAEARRVGDGGRRLGTTPGGRLRGPFWSPDGREFLINGYEEFPRSL